jgi:hypothetical protein
MSELIDRVFAALTPELWTSEAAAAVAAEPPVARLRRLIQAGKCAACGHRARAPRGVICAACRVTHGYCATCETVAPLADFYAPSPSRAARGARHGWHKPCHRGAHRRHATPQRARAALVASGKRVGRLLADEGRMPRLLRPVYAPDGRRIAASVRAAAAALGIDSRRLYEGRLTRYADGWILDAAD